MQKIKLKPSIGVKGIILILICGILIAVDLLTKHFEELYNWDLKIIPGFIEVLGGERNNGCVFGFLNDNPEIGQPILITFTFIMLPCLIFAFIFLPERFTILKISVAVVFAGAIGNLVDRIAFRQVRDFIGLNMLFNKNSLVYCNFADFCIVIGAILAMIDLLFLNEWAVLPLTKKAKAAQSKSNEAEEPPVEEKGPAPEWTLVEDESEPKDGDDSGNKEQ